jgi:hypothetical protein
MKPGRKPADESRAAAIRTRLVSWSQAPEGQRPSLRVLAKELGTTHQMLGFYLKGLDEWESRRQQAEYHRKAQEIRSKGLGMTYADEQQMIAYERAALICMVNRALDSALERLTEEAKAEGWTRKRIEFVKLAARKGHPAAQKLLQNLRNNLPATITLRS